MATAVLHVADVSCAHCERTITAALTPVEGVRRVEVDVAARRVRVDYDETRVSVERMRALLEEESYPVASLESF